MPYLLSGTLFIFSRMIWVITTNLDHKLQSRFKFPNRIFTTCNTQDLKVLKYSYTIGERKSHGLLLSK